MEGVAGVSVWRGEGVAGLACSLSGGTRRTTSEGSTPPEPDCEGDHGMRGSAEEEPGPVTPPRLVAAAMAAGSVG